MNLKQRKTIRSFTHTFRPCVVVRSAEAALMAGQSLKEKKGIGKGTQSSARRV